MDKIDAAAYGDWGAVVYLVVAGEITVVSPITVVIDPSVVVDHIENHGQSPCMRSVNQPDEFRDCFLRAGGVKIFRRKHIRGPVSFTGAAHVASEVGNGQQLNGVEAEPPNVIEFVDHIDKCGCEFVDCDLVVAPGKRSNVQLIDEEVLERRSRERRP